MPYNLYLEEAEDIDALVSNITNFNYWCASRILTPPSFSSLKPLLILCQALGKHPLVDKSLAKYSFCTVYCLPFNAISIKVLSK